MAEQQDVTIVSPQSEMATQRLTSRVAALTAKVEAEDKAALAEEVAAEEASDVGQAEHSKATVSTDGKTGESTEVDAVPQPKAKTDRAKPVQKDRPGDAQAAGTAENSPEDQAKLEAFNRIKESQLAISRKAKEIEAREEALRAREEELASKGSQVDRFLKNKDNPAELLDWIEENVPKEKLVEFFTEAATPADRQRVKIERQIQQEREERLKLERKLLEQDRRANETRVVAEVEKQFIATLDQHKDNYPHAGRLPKDFLLKAAHGKAEELHKIQQATGQEWGFHDILQSIERETAEFAGLFKEASSQESKTEKQSTPSRKATRNLNDSLSSESSGAGEVKKLSHADRVRRIARRYESS